MADFSQQNSPLQVFTPLSENTLLATRLSGREVMGDTYSFTVHLFAQAGTPIDFSKLLGAEARVRLRLPGGATRVFSGIIGEFSQRDGDDKLDHYTMVLRPSTHLLSLVRRSRIFQNLSAQQIIDRVVEPVLTHSGLKIKNFAGQTPIRSYCTQYRETDLQFLRRLCSESGVTYYWIHQPERRILKVTDNTSIGAPTLGTVDYRKTLGGSVDSTHIVSWQLTQQLSPPSVDVMDRHFQVSNQEIRATSSTPPEVQAGDLNLKSAVGIAPWEQDELSACRFFDGVNPSGGDDHNAIPAMFSSEPGQAEVGERAMVAGLVRAIATGNCCQLAPGHSFSLVGHPNQNGEWLVTTADHTVEVQGRFWEGEESVLKAEVRAECSPLSLRQAIWPILPRPTISGVVTGTIIGPENNEIFVDKFGRVQVRFWWDRQKTTTSCWVRVAQSWAGNGWGAAFWPRVGHEVVVAFENGDPDRPIIVGSVYNSDNMPPFPLPENRYIAGWRSLTQEGDPSKNFHQILMSDEKGSEVVHIHAEKTFIANQESRQVTMRPNLDMSFQG